MVSILGVAGDCVYGLSERTGLESSYGVALNSIGEILSGEDFKVYKDKDKNATIYSFNYFIKLLCASNPTALELLGLKAEHYLSMTDVGASILYNRGIFLSKQLIYRFGECIRQILKKLGGTSEQDISDEFKDIINQIEESGYHIQCKRRSFGDDTINIYSDNNELLVDMNVLAYPLKDLKCVYNKLKGLVSTYDLLNNNKVCIRSKVIKYMVTVIRYYYMLIDIMKTGMIYTYRADKDEHDLLVALNNGDYLNCEGRPVDEFYTVINHLNDEVVELEGTTWLPDNIDYNRVKSFQQMINMRVIKSGYQESKNE